MRFSERIGKKKPKCDLQVNSMDADLRNGLWNITWQNAIGQIKTPNYNDVPYDWRDFLSGLWRDFFKFRLDGLSWDHAKGIQEIIRKWFFEAEWYEVYDFLEFVAHNPVDFYLDTEVFKYNCNTILERELSGFRFIGDKITPITSEVEIDEVNEALDLAEKNALKGVSTHLESAIEKFSDRQNPDYRNSIKESISAVESLCAIICGDPKYSLGQALKRVKDTVGLHSSLEGGFSKIYGYTSNADGIRHAMIDESTCDFDDAKYMLVSCSAFVNYLIGKAGKAGLIK